MKPAFGPLLPAIATAIVCAGSLAAAPASATPPDVIDVRDEVFGITPGQVLVLRSTRDNLGLYEAEHRDVFLVAIDRASGKETLHPVYRAQTGPGEQADRPPRTQGSRLPGSVDPFEVLRKAGGIARDRSEWRTGPSASLRADAVSIAFQDGATVQLKLAPLLRRVSSSLDELAGAIGDYSRLAPISTRDLLAGQTFDAAACDFQEPMHYLGLDRTPAVRLMRVTCGAEEQSASLLVLVQD